MHDPNEGQITPADIATILVGAMIAYSNVASTIERLGLKQSDPATLTLYANSLNELGCAAPGTCVEQVFDLASQLLMQTEMTV